MPISILNGESEKRELIADLCDDDWNLSSQVKALDDWLHENRSSLPQRSYVADIGYSPRADAAGGGNGLSISMLRRLLDLNMEVFFSEYPPFENV